MGLEKEPIRKSEKVELLQIHNLVFLQEILNQGYRIFDQKQFTAFCV